jgi:hypothetical protein
LQESDHLDDIDSEFAEILDGADRMADDKQEISKKYEAAAQEM